MTEPLSAAVFASLGPIDLEIAGDTPGLYELASTMARIERKLGAVADRLVILPKNVAYFWEGASFESFTYATKQHADAIRPLADFAKQAASVTEAYSGLIERGRDHFADYADAATAAELVVTENRFIHPPIAPDMTCYTDGSDRDPKENYKYQVKLFQEIQELVATWWTDAEAWITTYFVPVIERIKDLTGIGDLIGHMIELGHATISETIDQAELRTSSDLADFLDKQQQYEDRWAEHQKDRRSRVPLRIARQHAFDENAFRQARTDIDTKIAKLGPADFLLKGGKVAGPLGSVAIAAWELHNGKSPSTVAVGLAGGTAGTALGGAAGGALVGVVAGAAAGPIGILAGAIAGAVVGGIAVGHGAEDGWEAWVPLRTRQAIDEGLEGRYRISYGLDPLQRDAPFAQGVY